MSLKNPNLLVDICGEILRWGIAEMAIYVYTYMYMYVCIYVNMCMYACVY